MPGPNRLQKKLLWGLDIKEKKNAQFGHARSCVTEPESRFACLGFFVVHAPGRELMADDLSISVRSNVKEVSRRLAQLAYQQVPFATAQAINAVAKLVKAGEVDNLKSVFPTATPFTLNSIGIKPATKADPEAIVYVRDIAAAYLEPFERGGTHKLIGAGNTWLNPKGVALDQYGNIPRRKLASLKGRPDVFVGTVKTKDGKLVNGVWQRPFRRAKTARRGRSRISKLSNTTGKLKLVIRFGDAIPVKQHLGWGAQAQRIVSMHWDAEFGRALAKAMATSR